MMKPIYSYDRQKLLRDQNQQTEEIAKHSSNSSLITSDRFWYRFLLVQGIGWLGGLGIVSGGMVWAQSLTSSDGVLISQIPDTMPKAVPNDNAPAPQVTTQNSPVFSRRERARLPQRSRVSNQTRTNSNVASSNAYIDSTDYSLGATTRRRNSPSRTYEPPSSVVLTERSTGCQRVVRAGGVAGSSCGNSVASTRTRVRRNSVASDSYSISRRQRNRSQVAERPSVDRSNRLSRSAQTEIQPRSYQVSRIPRSTNNDNGNQVREYRLGRVPRQIPNDDRFIDNRLSSTPRTNPNENRASEYRLSRGSRTSQTSRVTRTYQNNRLQRNTLTDRYASANQNTWKNRRRSAIVASIGAVNFGSSGGSRIYPITQNPTIGINGNNQIANDPTIRARALEYYYKHRNSTEAQTSFLGNSTLPIVYPLAVPAQITSMFGWRIHPISGDRRFHAGIDIGAAMGTPVLAAQTGRVAMAEYMGGYGLCIVIRHNNDTHETRYAHLSEIFVQPGELVEQGTAIGSVGSTGNSTGPHLHFEVRELTPQGWVAMNPSVPIENGLAQLSRNFQIGAIAQQFNPIQNYTKPIASNPNTSAASSPKLLASNFVPKLPPLQPLIPASELPEIVIPATVSAELPPPATEATTSQLPLPEIAIPKASETTAKVPEITIPKAPESTVQVPEIAIPKAPESTVQVPEITIPKAPESTVQVPEIKMLPKASETIFQLPEIESHITKKFEVSVPKLQSIGTEIQELLLPALEKLNIQPHIGN